MVHELVSGVAAGEQRDRVGGIGGAGEEGEESNGWHTEEGHRVWVAEIFKQARGVARTAEATAATGDHLQLFRTVGWRGRQRGRSRVVRVSRGRGWRVPEQEAGERALI